MKDNSLPKRYARGWYVLGHKRDFVINTPKIIPCFGSRLSIKRKKDGVEAHFDGIFLPVCEQNNLVFAWYDHQGLKPEYEIPVIEECFDERVLNEIKTLDETRTYILEVSSFQMEFVYHFSPTIAVYTNLSIDHLDRHGSMEEYLKMKLRMIQNMDQDDCVVYNGDDPELVSAVENQTIRLQPFSTTRSDTLYTWEGTSIKNHSGKSLAGLDEIGIPGDHNLSNLLSAATCSHLLGIPDDHISQVMKTFTGVEHRLEHVLTINDVQYINDSKATNINSVIVAIDTFKQPIILILGGRNKGADFRLLLPHIKSSHVRDVISYGEAGGQIDAALGDAVRSVQVTDLNSAVKKAQVLAAPGDIVLLSPGCASFDEFSNFEVRGQFFKSAVMEIKAV